GRRRDSVERDIAPFVAVGGGRPHDRGGEVVHPLLDLLLILVEGEGELCHAQILKLPVGNQQQRGQCHDRTEGVRRRDGGAEQVPGGGRTNRPREPAGRLLDA